MTPDEQSQAERLGRAWDDLTRGQLSVDPDLTLLADIQAVQDLLAVPPASREVRAAIWSQVSGNGLVTTLDSPASTPVHSNGHAHWVPSTVPIAPARASAPVTATLWTNVKGWNRMLAIGSGAGFAAGFGAGIWTRLAMRVAGMLTVDQNRGLLTDADAVVGRITLAGSLFLGLFGAGIGIVGGVLYIAIRQRLRGNRVVRAGMYGLFLYLVFGFVLMDENNPDYHLFGPTLLNVGTFSGTYFVYGALVSVIVESLLPFRARAPEGWRGWIWLRASQVASVGWATLGGIALFLTLLSAISFPAAALMVALFLAALAPRVMTLPSLRGVVSGPRLGQVGTALILVPGLIGFYLTIDGVARILTG